MPADRHFVQSRKPNSARSRLRSYTAVRSTDETRSRIMRSVKSKDTGPERRLRSLLWNMGYRFRLHYKGLPGNPDCVMPEWNGKRYSSTGASGIVIPVVQKLRRRRPTKTIGFPSYGEIASATDGPIRTYAR